MFAPIAKLNTLPYLTYNVYRYLLFTKEMLDLAIIGSGPNALSLVSKILCPDPDQSTKFAFGFESKAHLSTKNVYRKLIGGKPRKDLLEKIKVTKTS